MTKTIIADSNEKQNQIKLQIQTFGIRTYWNARKGYHMEYPGQYEVKTFKDFYVDADISEEEIKAMCLSFAEETYIKYNHISVYTDNKNTHTFKPEDLEIQETEDVLQFNLKNLHNLVSDGAIFSVEFIKRSNGQIRRMVCRMGVKKHLRGGDKTYSTKQHNLLTVFDMENKGYRSIPVDAVRSLKVNGQSFSFGGVA